MRSILSWLAVPALAIVLVACGAGGSGGGGGGGGDGGGNPQPPPAVVLPPGSGTMVVQATIPVGDFSACNGLGGVHIDWGIDANANGQLDPSEIAGSGDVCNGSSTTRQILVAGPERPWDQESRPGYFYAVNQIGSTTWERVASMSAKTGDGPQYFYDAYLLTNPSDAARYLDFAVNWWSGNGGILAAYTGGFNPSTPLANLVAFEDSYWDGPYANALPITLNPGESRVVVASSGDPFFATGYEVYLTSSTPFTATAAHAGVSGTVGEGNLFMNRVSGLRAGGSYNVTVHSTGYTQGNQVDVRTWTDPLWDGMSTGSFDPVTGDTLAQDQPADENGYLWPAVYGTNIPSSGAYTLKFTPGKEALYTPVLGVPTQGSVSNLGETPYSDYYIEFNTGILKANTLYTVKLDPLSDPLVTATIVDNSAKTGSCSLDGGIVTCTITTRAATTITYLRLRVNGSATLGGATYTLLATGPSGSDTLWIDVPFSASLAGQHVNTTQIAQYFVAGAVNGGSYRVHLSGITHPAVTVSVTDDGENPEVNGSGSCSAVVGGEISCTYTAGTDDPSALIVQVNGSATTGGSDFTIEASRPAPEEEGALEWGTISGSVAYDETYDYSAYLIDVWPSTTYTVMLSNVTHDGVTAELYEVEEGGDVGECGIVDPVTHTLTCTITMDAERPYPDPLLLKVHGEGTANGAWYDITLQ